MKKKYFIIAAVLLCVMPLSMVNAQRTAGTFSFSGFGSMGMPIGPEDFKTYWKTSFGFGGGLKYNLSRMLSFSASYTYQPFKPDFDELLDIFGPSFELQWPGVDIELDGMNVNFSIISANLIQYFSHPGASAGFYLTAGGSYYIYTVSDLEFTGSGLGVTVDETWDLSNEGDDGFGINGGVGFEIELASNMSLFIEALYNYLFIDMGEVDGEGEDKISFITAKAGILINL